MRHPNLFLVRGLAAAAALSLAACAGTPEPEAAATPRNETVWAVTDAAELMAGWERAVRQTVAT